MEHLTHCTRMDTQVMHRFPTTEWSIVTRRRKVTCLLSASDKWCKKKHSFAWAQSYILQWKKYPHAANKQHLLVGVYLQLANWFTTVFLQREKFHINSDSWAVPNLISSRCFQGLFRLLTVSVCNHPLRGKGGGEKVRVRGLGDDERKDRRRLQDLFVPPHNLLSSIAISFLVFYDFGGLKFMLNSEPHLHPDSTLTTYR